MQQQYLQEKKEMSQEVEALNKKIVELNEKAIQFPHSKLSLAYNQLKDDAMREEMMDYQKSFYIKRIEFLERELEILKQTQKQQIKEIIDKYEG